MLPCVCGAESFEPVPPTAADLVAFESEVILAAELVDLSIHLGLILLPYHQVAAQLSEACRQLALARAGVLVR